MAHAGSEATPQSALAPHPPEFTGYWRMVWRRFRRHRPATVGAVVALGLFVLALSGPALTGHRADVVRLSQVFRPPGAGHLLGTDELGRDVLTRLMLAGRVSLAVGLAATSISTTIGTLVGFVAGYYGRWMDAGLMRLIEIFLSIPSLAAMFVLAKFLGTGLTSIIVVLCLFGWMFTARLVRGEVLRIKRLDFVDAAVVIGASNRRIIVHHLLPNVLPPIIVTLTLAVGQAILAESTISYFGLGIQPPVASWGNMLQNAQEYLWSAPWLAIYPGIAILITVLSFNFMGDGLRDSLDPSLKR